MKRNCNLELRLVTPSVFSHSSDHGGGHNSMLDLEDPSPNEKQKLTIFYNGKVAACDVTELQARAIISLAGRETEDQKSSNSSGSEPSSPAINSPIYSPTTVLSMKRSLQRFLQKRKTRAQAISPYPVIKHSHDGN
ncbi:hypothetical protein CDL12_23409 [Handroanthus impetiginosus]|uniref:Protein TIFY n=1 Tax=Handroanthus impetiginosus TaxID=429701 RepID=A0A2G9GFS2_9LAMI|nr:hypothetical protein CDL12_23409 [Handroanthus impetiginosus]